MTGEKCVDNLALHKGTQHEQILAEILSRYATDVTDQALFDA